MLQRAVQMVLKPIYEQNFRNCSYGFRPGRSAHQALEDFWKQMMTMVGGWVVPVDLKSFFDKLNHSHLQQLLRKRVHDGVLLRLDEWVEGEVMPRLKDRAFLVRFADDFVLGFSKERARRRREMSSDCSIWSVAI